MHIEISMLCEVPWGSPSRHDAPTASATETIGFLLGGIYKGSTADDIKILHYLKHSKLWEFWRIP